MVQRAPAWLGLLLAAASPAAVPAWVAAALVFFCAACVLVLEILAVRLLAPYVGISLETYTSIIGTVLAGIAAGSWLGGRAADRVDPRRLRKTFTKVAENPDVVFDATPVAMPETVDRGSPARAASDLHCLTHPSIDAWEQRLRNERRLWAATVHSIGRGSPVLPRVREIVAEAGLPAGIALLPAIESGFRPTARDGAGSAGLWQLQPATARRFGLVVNARRDDRLHLERSTRAATRYLRALHRRYGTWPLALAAYNAGEGRVDRALRRRPGASFWELAEARHLPPISRAYVPRFLALVRVAGPTSTCS